MGQLVVRHPRVGAVFGLLVGGVGAAYLWASLTGHGLHGALSGARLDNAPTYPNANAAGAAATALAGGGWMLCMLAVLQAAEKAGTGAQWRLCAGTVVAVPCVGAAFFLISLAIWNY